MPLNQDIKFLKGVGPRRAELFAKCGVSTVGGLLRFYPRVYEDFTSPVPITSAQPGQICCIRATVASPVREARIRKGMTLYKFRAADDTGVCGITYFNNPYIKNSMVEGRKYFFYGKIGGTLLRREMTSPEFEPADSGTGLRPVYPLTAGLTVRMVRAAVSQALKLTMENLNDPLPESLRKKYQLCHLRFALEKIHFPLNSGELAQARRRLVFEELLLLQIGMSAMKNRDRKTTSAVCEATDFSPFYQKLPFKPTNAQKRAIEQAAKDMCRPVPMNRLIEGDVGSGKTLVAAALCYLAAKNGFQSALMAPTETLARQHLISLKDLLAPFGIRIGLLTGGLSAGEKTRVQEQIRSHELDLVVGTHALITEKTEYDRLGLVITDEQHRFGVAQRAALSSKGANPHMLVMSATPIPRTLALIIYGDLDISVLDEMPYGRLPVRTYLVDSSKRQRVYRFIKQHIANGFQAFIVCPLVDSGDEDLADAENYARRIVQEDLQGTRVGMLHGRLSSKEKDGVMQKFASGKLDVLVSTTVIEVGVDVPNAVVMVIENAERFGLSQLHQLRGRVGRSHTQSYCILISDTGRKETLERLKILRDHTDGFQIAEKDLEQRGPGDFFGQKQHGLPELKIADLLSDMPLLQLAREAAAEVMSSDPLLNREENRPLRAAVSELFQNGIVFN